uniref:ATP synthase complex subunit 8 n=1 Tax=Platyplectrum melanopyga TaxID=3345241 RepID=K9JYV6_PLAME|nr:ATP synthase F0 subunit 8 [Lechriodus melanopyga]AEC33153.1 ATP synthase F0 subunit 8 [Lechriodus melanopyga]
MPQLNPSPWFFIFIVSWVIFILISLIKVSSFYFPNNPSPKHYKNLNSTWTWPWT